MDDAERRLLERVDEALGVGVVRVDGDGVAWASPSATGLARGWADVPAWWRAIAAMPADRGGPRRVDVISPAGRRAIYDVSASADSAGQVWFVRSLTERVEAEEEAERVRAELAATRDAALGASRAKSAFLANMSHELRTPLNAILGYGEMLFEEAQADGNASAEADLQKILSAGRHLLQLISDVLDLSKIEAGRIAVQLADTDVRAMLTEVTTALANQAALRNNRVEIRVADGVGMVRTDGVKLKQIVQNLVSNAIKFTENGKIAITVEVAGTELQIAVQDSGIGIDDAHQARLFTDFYQADSSTTRKYGGTGLGLSISRRLVQMMGGRIELSSRVGQGSTFLIAIPVRGAESSTIAPLMNASGSSIADVLASGRRPILVIDDDPTLGDLMVRYLGREGLPVIVARDGAEGIAIARQIKPAVITLDVMMPGASGWAVLQQIKGEPALADVPVIMVTMIDDHGAGAALGAADYLTKPLSRDRLVGAIRRHLPGRSGPILVVEDDEAIRDLAVRTLAREGFPVEGKADGRQAIAWLENNVPALIMLDLMMPEVDGFGVLAWLRASAPHVDVPIIVVTAMDAADIDPTRLVGNVRTVVQKGARGGDGVVAEIANLVKGLSQH